MKFSRPLVIVCFLFTAAAGAQVDVSDRVPAKLQSHFIFDHGVDENGAVAVKGFPAFERTDENNVRRTGLDYKQAIQTVGRLHPEIIDLEKRAGRAVLKANFTMQVPREEIGADGTPRKVVYEYMGNGSAIVVGKKYVLTNRHVLDVLKKDQEKIDCPGGWLSSGEEPSLRVQCQAVIACGDPLKTITIPDAKFPEKTSRYAVDNYDDWCLLEVTPTPSGKNIGEEVTPLPISRDAFPSRGDKVATIGNPAGKGIQASWGLMKSAPASKSRPGQSFSTSAFALSGNSGGALINTRGQLLGLVYSSDPNDIATADALTNDQLLKRMAKKLPEEILEQISDEASQAECDPEESTSEEELRAPGRLSRWFKKVKKFIKAERASGA